jgi:hypothetical protein
MASFKIFIGNRIGSAMAILEATPAQSVANGNAQDNLAEPPLSGDFGELQVDVCPILYHSHPKALSKQKNIPRY